MSSSTRIRAVLFDMDGVLLDSFDAWLATVQDACRHYGSPVVEPEVFRKVFGAGTETDVATFLPTATSAELDRFYHETFPRHAGKILVEREARETLDRLRVAGIRVGCVTNSVLPVSEPLLRRHGIFPLLDVLATPTETLRPKPAPDMVNAALRKLAVSCDEALLVGDTRYDMLAARKALVRAVGFRIDSGDQRIDALSRILDLVRDSEDD